MNYAFKTIAVVLALGVLSINANANSKCGKIKIAEMNWASAELIANIDKIILEEKFGCQVQLVSGATIPIFNFIFYLSNDKKANVSLFFRLTPSEDRINSCEM